MNRYKRKLSKRNKHQSKSNKLSQLKAEIQKEQRKAYWNYIENMIFDIPVPEQDSSKINKHPKNLFSDIKTQKQKLLLYHHCGKMAYLNQTLRLNQTF